MKVVLILQLLSFVFFPVKSSAGSVLHDAAWEGHTETVKALIAAGADVNAKNLLGYASLFYAAKKGHAEIVEILKAAGVGR